MIQLPAKFKNAIAGDVSTSIYPIVRIYKGVRADEQETWQDAESFNISIKPTTLSDIDFEPLLLSMPNIKSKADIIDNKFTISNVSMDISNLEYNSKIFSDEVPSFLNSVCQIFFCANGIEEIEDCLLVYTGLIRQYKQHQNKVNIIVEDITQQLLKVNIPSTLVPQEDVFASEDVGKPFPMVYGFVDKSPLIKQYVGLNDFGQLRNRLAELHVDKTRAYILGLWDSNTIIYNLPSEHRLFTQNILKSKDAHIYVYNEDNFTPIHREIPEDWGFGQFSLSETVGSSIVYDFNLQFNDDSRSTFKLNTGAVLGGSNLGIPSRVYRPIESCEFFTYNDNDNSGNGHSINKIYGFTEFTSGTPASFKYYKDDNIYDDVYYQNNWNNSQTWWQPTSCNNNNNGGVFGSIDINWAQRGRDSKFPVERLQDGTLGTGLWFTSKNEDGPRGNGDMSGGSFVRLILKNNIGHHECGTAIYYDAECHSYSGMNQPDDMPYHSQFFTNRELVVQSDSLSDLIDNNNCETIGEVKDVGDPVTENGPFLPNPEFEDVIYGDQVGTEDSVRKLNAVAVSESFTTTDEFDSIQFGVPQYDRLGNGAGGHTGYNSTQLFNAWVIQDTLIHNPLEYEYYGSVAGRGSLLNDPFSSETFFVSTIEIKPVGNGIYDEFEYVLELGPGNSAQQSRLMAERISEYIRIYGSGSETLFLKITKPDLYVNVYDNFNEPYLGDNGMYQMEITDLPLGSFNEVGTFQVQLDFYLFTKPQLALITGSDKILENILTSELNYKGKIISKIPRDDWQFSFTLNEQIEAKRFFEDFFKSTLQIPSYNEEGNFKFIEIKQIIDDYSTITLINTDDVLKYSYHLTELDDIYTSVNVKYNKNYATGKYDSETDYSLVDGDKNLYDNYQTLSEFINNNSDDSYNIDYYGLLHEECKLDFETEYIRDHDTARKLQKRLVSWYANQHLIIKLDLPITYLNLEAGDYIKFEKLIDNKKAFGYDYSKQEFRNGQLIYDVFFVTNIQKKLDKVLVEMVQVHRGQYGKPDSGISNDPSAPFNDDGTINGQGNHTLPDPSDNSNYDSETITDEFIDMPDVDFLNVYFTNQTTSLESQVLNAVINTNTLESWDYKIFVSYVSSSDGFITYPEDAGLPFNILQDGIYNEENDPPGMELVNHSKSVSELFENLNGTITISKKYDLIIDDPNDYAEVTFLLKVFNSQFESYVLFTQRAESYTTYLNGDVNNDGVLNILDVVKIVNWILIASEAEDGFGFLSIPEYGAADFNNDGDINVLDVVALVNRILT